MFNRLFGLVELSTVKPRPIFWLMAHAGVAVTAAPIVLGEGAAVDGLHAAALL